MSIKFKIFVIFLVVFIAGITFFKIGFGSEKQSFSARDLGEAFFIDSIIVSKDFITIQVNKERGIQKAPLIFLNIRLEIETSPDLREHQLRENEFKQTGKTQLRVGEGLVMAQHEFGYSMIIKKIKDGVAWIKYESDIQDYVAHPPIVSHTEYIVKIDKQYKRDTQTTNSK